MPTTREIPAHPEAITLRKPGVRVDRIIIHTMEGSLKGSVEWARRSRTERAASLARRDVGKRSNAYWIAHPASYPTAAHYYVGKGGDIVQMVPDAMKCAHANNYNSRSIGIEHEARAALGDFTEEMLQASAKVCAVMLRKFGIPLDGDHIIGHYMVPGTTHTDPGSKFPWIDYLDMVEKRYHTLSEW